MNDLARVSDSSELILFDQAPLDRNPAAVYLASLQESGRRTQRTALDTIAGAS